MIHTENTLKIAISDSDATIVSVSAPTCIICLLDTPIMITYSGNCECHPQIHEQCLEQWFTENSNACPICRKLYNEHATTILPVYRRQRPTDAYVCCCLCFFCVCMLPFAIVVLVVIFKK